MTPDDFSTATFTASEVDAAWHVYGALLTYSINCPEVLNIKGFADALDYQRGMFNRMFERLER